ncbi:MAG: hypothetical protein R3B45_13000 [Bdellovibrionota bacterium]
MNFKKINVRLLVFLLLLNSCRSTEELLPTSSSLTAAAVESSDSCISSVRVLRLAKLNSLKSKPFDSSIFAFKQLDFVKDVKIPESKLSEVSAAASDLGVNFNGNTYAELLEDVSKALDASEGTPLEKGDKMSRFVARLDGSLNELPKNKRLHVQYLQAISVLRLEAYPKSAWVSVKKAEFETVGLKALNFDDYKVWTKAYLKNEDPYKSLNPVPYGGGVLSYKKIREMIALNTWPVDLKPHDMTHVHYYYGHPQAGATYFDAARSMNHKRYFILSGFFESVDTTQYAWESALARHFKEKNFTIEEASFYISRATDEQLDEIMTNNTVANQFNSWMSEFKDWQPVYTKLYPIEGSLETVCMPMLINLLRYISVIVKIRKKFHGPIIQIKHNLMVTKLIAKIHTFSLY